MLKRFNIKVDGYAYCHGRHNLTVDNFQLTYELEVEVREYGIKNIYFSPLTISGYLSWTEINFDSPDHDETEHEELFEWDYASKDSDKFKIVDSTEFHDDGSFAPVDITVDFDRKEIEIS